jgi:hypothetical protein
VAAPFVSAKIAGMPRHILAMGLLIVAACSAPPMRWERPGTADVTRDEAECGAAAHQEAVRRLPYGDGPPIWGVYRKISLLQWQQEIDNERYYLERDLVSECMHHKGYGLVPISR